MNSTLIETKPATHPVAPSPQPGPVDDRPLAPNQTEAERTVAVRQQQQQQQAEAKARAAAAARVRAEQAIFDKD